MSLRSAAQPRPDEDAPRAAIITLASQYGRYGYRLITGLLRQAGWGSPTAAASWPADLPPAG